MVIKAYQPRWTGPFLAAVRQVQELLHAGGFPCAAPIAGPVPFGAGFATVESLLVAPAVFAAMPGDAQRRVSAAGLAWQVNLARPGGDDPRLRVLADHPLHEQSADLWGEPHSPLFDFGPGTGTPPALLVDGLAERAQAQRESVTGRAPVIVHTDWSLRNIRLSPAGDALVAVYDWDSLALIAETTAVGQAAQTWNATGEPASPPRPDADEVAAYVRDYEAARGKPFTAEQRRAIGGAALYNLCYIGRCELARERRYPDVEHDRGARERIERDGDRLLCLDRVLADRPDRP